MTPQALVQAKVFPHAVTNRTVAADFERARIAPDAEGRIADLHALRTTLGTNLARRGVSPQVAQTIMRHADYRTTLDCYTVLGLAVLPPGAPPLTTSHTPSSWGAKHINSPRRNAVTKAMDQVRETRPTPDDTRLYAGPD